MGYNSDKAIAAAKSQFGVKFVWQHRHQYRDGHSRKIGAGERQPGDLVFYGKPSDVHHVALYIGNNRMIEAQRTGVPVKVSALRTKQALYVRIV
ncbi:Invertase [Mortierella antarctica]|nr:Invertase [Mortierella antarctica]